MSGGTDVELYDSIRLKISWVSGGIFSESRDSRELNIFSKFETESQTLIKKETHQNWVHKDNKLHVDSWT